MGAPEANEVSREIFFLASLCISGRLSWCVVGCGRLSWRDLVALWLRPGLTWCPPGFDQAEHGQGESDVLVHVLVFGRLILV